MLSYNQTTPLIVYWCSVFCNHIRICHLKFISRKHSAKCWQCWLCTTASSSQQPLQASVYPNSQTTGRYFSFFLFAKRKFSKKEAPVCPSSQTTGIYFSFSILLFCRSVSSFNMTDATYMVSWAGKFLTNGASSSTFHPCESETRHFWGIFSETVFAKALWSGNCKVTQFQWQESWIIAKITIKRKRPHQLEFSITRVHFSSLSTKKPKVPLCNFSRTAKLFNQNQNQK